MIGDRQSGVPQFGARRTRSSGGEAPSRNEKLLWQCNSAYRGGSIPQPNRTGVPIRARLSRPGPPHTRRVPHFRDFNPWVQHCPSLRVRDHGQGSTRGLTPPPFERTRRRHRSKPESTRADPSGPPPCNSNSPAAHHSEALLVLRPSNPHSPQERRRRPTRCWRAALIPTGFKRRAWRVPHRASPLRVRWDPSHPPGNLERPATVSTPAVPMPRSCFRLTSWRAGSPWAGSELGHGLDGHAPPAVLPSTHIGLADPLPGVHDHQRPAGQYQHHRPDRHRPALREPHTGHDERHCQQDDRVCSGRYRGGPSRRRRAPGSPSGR